MTANPGSNRMRRVATIMSAATIALGVLLMTANAIVWLDDSVLSATLRSGAIAANVESAPNAVQKAIGFGLSLPLLALMLWGLWNAFRLFQSYRRIDVLTPETGRRIRRVGIALVLIPIVSTITGTLSGLALTWNNSEGHRQFAISVSSNSLLMLISGAMLIMIGWTMVEAARIAEEHRQFV